MQLTVSQEAEQALIGEILLQPEIFMECLMEELEAHDFSIEQNRVIYECFRVAFVTEKPIEVITILTLLPQAELADYKTYMYTVSSATITTAHYKQHIQIVRDTARISRAVQQAKQFIQLSECSGNLEQCREMASNILKPFDGTDGTEVVTAKQGYNDFIDNIGKVHEYYKTGFEKLDKYIQITKGDFVGIAGRPSSGKTAFSLEMMLKMSETQRVTYFSCETKPAKLFERMIANYATYDYGEIRKGGLSDDAILKIKKACSDDFPSLGFKVVSAAGWTVERIKSKALQLKSEVIFIDYLGLLTASSGKSQYEKVTQISIDLHTMAQKDNMLIISLIQLNREGKGVPDMSQLRDSGQLEQDLDVVLLLHTPNDDDDHRNIKQLTIAKNKDGQVGIIDLNFVGQYQQFRPIETAYQENNARLPYGEHDIIEI